MHGDAASLSVAILKKRLHNQILLGCDNHPLSRDSISTELATLIQSEAPDETSVTEKEAKIEELMEMSLGLLQCMGVSHASIENVLRTTLKYKLASKLTGAGGGEGVQICFVN